LWRLIVTLHLLFHLVLGEKALVPRCVIVVREELGQEKVHVLPWLAVLVAAPLSGCVVAGRMHLGKVLYVYVVASAFGLHALAFVTSGHSVTMTDCWRLPTVLARLKTVVSHAKHFTSEGLGHNCLPRLSGRGRQTPSPMGTSARWVSNGVTSVRLVANDVMAGVQAGNGFFEAHRAVVDIRSVLVLATRVVTLHRLHV
jgi:hypothetical protein